MKHLKKFSFFCFKAGFNACKVVMKNDKEPNTNERKKWFQILWDKIIISGLDSKHFEKYIELFKNLRFNDLLVLYNANLWQINKIRDIILENENNSK